MSLDSGAPAARMPRLAGAVLRTQPDERLAALAGEGSRPAFEELMGRYRARLVAFAAGIAPPAAADDVVQDAMLKAHLALARGDRPEAPKPWLFTIVRNTALNHRRGWRPHEPLDESIDGVEQPPEAAERRRRFGALVMALGDLPSAQREAIVQRELEGRGHEEIAGTMGVSSGAVRQLIHRARITLRTGAAAVVPMSLLRLIALPGAAEPAVSGVGITAAKLGVGAALATGALIGGADVAEQVGVRGSGSAPAAAEASAQPPGVSGTYASEQGEPGGSRARAGLKRSEAKRLAGERPRQPRQPRRPEYQQPRPPRDPARESQGGTQQGGEQPPEDGTASGGGGSKPSGGGQSTAPAGGGLKPAPQLPAVAPTS